MFLAYLLLLFLPAVIQSVPVQEIVVEDSHILHEAAKNGKIDILIRFVKEEKEEHPEAIPGNNFCKLADTFQLKLFFLFLLFLLHTLWHKI